MAPFSVAIWTSNLASVAPIMELGNIFLRAQDVREDLQERVHAITFAPLCLPVAVLLPTFAIFDRAPTTLVVSTISRNPNPLTTFIIVSKPGPLSRRKAR